jgi:hypothetical protein
VIFGATVCHKEAIVCMFIQIVDALHHELVIVSSAFDNLGIEDMWYESQKVIIIATSG